MSTSTVVYGGENSTPHSGLKSKKESSPEVKAISTKENFLRSESSCDSDSSGSLHEGRKRCRRLKRDPKAKGKSEEVDDEKKELEKLLRLGIVDSNPSKVSCSEEEREEETKRDVEVMKKTVKLKTLAVSLIDCMNSATESEDQSRPDWEKDKKSETDFLSEANDQVKAAFLLTSSEGELSGVEEGEEKADKKKTSVNTEKKAEEGKRKKDDLSAYRISEASSGDEAWKESASGEVKVQSESEQSVWEEKSNGTAGSDTESDDVVITPNSEYSPTKGRRNIQKILKKEHLQLETKQALKMETERKKRLSQRQKVFDELYPGAGAQSKLVLDVDLETKEELVVVDECLGKMLKPHQREGVRFMWNCCFESLGRLEEDSGSGCVLAHCMGLGKTLQVITLVHTILTHETGVRTVLIICPLNTIRNWIYEFKIWLKGCKKKIRPFHLIPCQNGHERNCRVKTWAQAGGVLVVSYEMFRSLVIKENQNLRLSKCLLDPGPDLVVCDEGHVLKNENSALSKCVTRIKTLRRIILTGTPLQNNLKEYYCMVQFVKPNILGTKKEFANRFINPISNGQFEDSTQADVRRMKRRAHVLHTMLDGFIQRFGYYVLTPFLPEKQEYVISVSLTETQQKIYRMFLKQGLKENRGLFQDFHWCQKVWTHPRLMVKHSERHASEDGSPTWKEFFREEEYEDIRSSGKLVLLFSIIKRCGQIGDKVLVFSQSLYSLELIEHFLWKSNQDYETGAQTEYAEKWVSGQDYFRLDGSTSSKNRDTYCQKFNDPRNKRSRLFLISTRAGGLGINLVAANRVIVFDASWNPIHDVQSIFRVYRFGQTKPCFIYRFLAAATMEEKIYRRQVTKLSLAHRILDEHQIERHFTMGNLQELYTFDPIPKDEWRIPKVPKDPVFADILSTSREIIVGYHEHDSLLENKEEEELTEEERKAAWDDFEKEKLTPEGATNGASVPNPNCIRMEQLNTDALRMVHSYRQSIAQKSQLLFVNQSQNQICRITEVRTLKRPENEEERARWERMLELGRSKGLKPYEDESIDSYCRRVEKAFWQNWGSSIQEGANPPAQKPSGV